MSRSPLWLAALFLAAWLTACGAPAASPAAGSTPSPTELATATLSATATAPRPPPAQTYAAKTVAGGGVTVKVTPTSMAPGAPLAFDVAMDTHSVDLTDDLLKVAVLRDEQGTEYKPTVWDGAGPGGHHRQGTLKFPAMPGSPKTVILVLKDVAGVPERVFQWTLVE